jgi:hypothetical protein
VEPVKLDPMPNARFEAELDAALRHAPEVQAPRNFRQRLMTRLPEIPPAETPRTWQLPVRVGIAAFVFGALTSGALKLGLVGWLVRPGVLLAVLAIETAIALTWLWRTVFSR